MLRLLRDFVAAYRVEIFFLVLISACSAALQMFSLVLAFDYISILVSGSARLGILKQWLSGDLNSFLNLIPILVLIMLLTSTSLGYIARRISVKAMLNHERRCIRELIGTLHDLTYLPWGEYTQADIVRLASKDIRQYGRLVDAFLDACLPTALFASALIVLFYLSISASIGVLALISLFLLIFYRSSRRVANLSLELETSSKDDIDIRRSAIAGSLSGTGMIKPMPTEDLDSLVTHPAINRFLSAYGRRLLISYKALWIAGSFLAVLTSLVLLYLGRELAAGNNIIADVLIYFVVLNFLLVQVRSFSSAVTKVRVFQPFAERYANFVDSLTRLESEEEEDFTLTGARDQNGNIVPERTLKKGERIAAVYPGAINKIAVGEVYYSLGAGLNSNLAPYVAQYDLSNMAKRTQLLSSYTNRYRSLLNEAGHLELIRVLDDELAIEANSCVANDKLHRRVWLILQIAECVWDSPNRVCIIDSRGLRGIRLKALQELEKMLSERITIVIYPSIPERPAFSVSGYYLCGHLPDITEPTTVDDMELA